MRDIADQRSPMIGSASRREDLQSGVRNADQRLPMIGSAGRIGGINIDISGIAIAI